MKRWRGSRHPRKQTDPSANQLPPGFQVESCDSIWDPTGALARVDGDLPFLKEMIQLFVSNGPKLIAELETAIGAGDAPSVMKAAHAIKGNVATFCATAAFDQAFVLETKGKNGDLHGVAQDFQELKSRLLTLEHSLAEIVDNGACVTSSAAATSEGTSSTTIIEVPIARP